jgi:hypothetical protein
VLASREVLNYQWSKDVNYLDAAIPLLEKSLEWYRELVDLTKDTYLYANSMQTQQRRIPISGGDAKNKTWEEMLPHYEAELAALKANTELLKNSDKQEAVEIQPVANADVKLKGAWQRVVYGEGISPFVDRKELVVEAVAPELKGMQGFVFNGVPRRSGGYGYGYGYGYGSKYGYGYGSKKK